MVLSPISSLLAIAATECPPWSIKNILPAFPSVSIASLLCVRACDSLPYLRLPREFQLSRNRELRMPALTNTAVLMVAPASPQNASRSISPVVLIVVYARRKTASTSPPGVLIDAETGKLIDALHSGQLNLNPSKNGTCAHSRGSGRGSVNESRRVAGVVGSFFRGDWKLS